MIVLHRGDGAAARVARILESATGEVFAGGAARALPDYIDEIADWLAAARQPELIVIDSARAETNAERQALRSLRRMAKFRGVDVHLVGADDVKPVADRVIDADVDLDQAVGAGAGAQAARLLHAEEMEPFRRAAMDIPHWREIMASSGCSEEEAKAKAQWMAAQEVWVNNLYQVNIDFGPEGDTAHLIIRRLDRQPIHNWPHFQAIKNELLGPECEAVELYPPESHLVDDKHHYHLWGFRRPELTFGIGFRDGRQVRDDK